MVTMKKLLLTVCTVLALCLAGCAKGGSYTAGTYTASAKGMGGDVNVSVTFSKSAITKIEIGAHNETPGISDTPIKEIPAQIIKTQSLAVDTVSGATVTSNAILNAAEAALAESGANVAFFKNAVKKAAAKKKAVTKKADVVIVGAGGAGLAAAVSAKQAGASVIIVEKMPSVGGSTIISGGQYNAFDPGRQHKIQLRKGNLDAVNRFINTEPANDLHKELIEKVKAQLKEYKDSNATYTFDSAEFHALQTFEGGDRVGNHADIQVEANSFDVTGLGSPQKVSRPSDLKVLLCDRQARPQVSVRGDRLEALMRGLCEGLIRRVEEVGVRAFAPAPNSSS